MFVFRTRAATRVPLGVPLHVKPVHIPTPAAAPVLDVPWIMPITEDSVPRPDPNPASVDSGNRTVTNPNSSDPPVKPTHLPEAKSPILGAIRPLLSDSKTYAAAVITADALFNSGRGIGTLVTRAG